MNVTPVRRSDMVITFPHLLLLHAVQPVATAAVAFFARTAPAISPFAAIKTPFSLANIPLLPALTAIYKT